MFALTIVVVAITLLIADAIWLGWLAAPMYQELRELLNPGVKDLPYRIIPAILAYASMVISLSVLSVPRVVADVKTSGEGARLMSSLFWGGMWGLGVYGTYDATNMAVIQSYPAKTGIIDAIWGMLLGSIGAYMGSLSDLSK